MSGKPVIEQLLLQDRVITGSAMGLILLIAVIYTILGVGMPMSAVQMTAMNAVQGMAGTSEGQAMHSMQTNGLMMPAMWTATYAGLVFLMWWIMMIAMMLPSVASTVLLYTTLIRRGNQAVNAPKLAFFFLTGYLAVWGLFSLLATLAQWFLELRGFVSPMGHGAHEQHHGCYGPDYCGDLSVHTLETILPRALPQSASVSDREAPGWSRRCLAYGD